VHIAKKRIYLENFAVNKAFEENFFACFEKPETEKPFEYFKFVGVAERQYPVKIFIGKSGCKYDYANTKREYKRIVIHSENFINAWLILTITLRVLTPRGQASEHLPQSMHLAISVRVLAISPLLTSVNNLRRFISVKMPALQVAVQVPQAIQMLNEGS